MGKRSDLLTKDVQMANKHKKNMFIHVSMPLYAFQNLQNFITQILNLKVCKFKKSFRRSGEPRKRSRL